MGSRAAPATSSAGTHTNGGAAGGGSRLREVLIEKVPLRVFRKEVLHQLERGRLVARRIHDARPGRVHQVARIRAREVVVPGRKRLTALSDEAEEVVVIHEA